MRERSRSPRSRASTSSLPERRLEAVARLREHGAEDLLDLGELRGADRERRGELDHRVAAVVGSAVEARVVQCSREEAAQEQGILHDEGAEEQVDGEGGEAVSEERDAK